MNMGEVAHFIYKRYVMSGASGRFLITYHPVSGEAMQAHEQMRAGYPLQLKEEKVVAGYMPLVPVTNRSAYRAWIEVG